MAIAVEKWSRILKVVGKMFAGLLLLMGGLSVIVFGIIGVGPDGAIPAGSRVPAFVGGIINMLLAVLYWLPNEKLEPYRKSYLAFALYLPLAGYSALMCLLLYTLATDPAFREVAAGFFAGYFVLGCLAFSAPVSFLLYLKAKEAAGSGRSGDTILNSVN